MQKHNSEVCTTIRCLNYANLSVVPVLCNPSQITRVHSSHRQYCKTRYLQVIESNKLLCSVIEIALRHGCSPVNWLHIFRTPFLKKTTGRLVLYLHSWTLTQSERKLSGCVLVLMISVTTLIKVIHFLWFLIVSERFINMMIPKRWDSNLKIISKLESWLASIVNNFSNPDEIEEFW